jgi:NADH-ubiquinone oxidoreductase chain 4
MLLSILYMVSSTGTSDFDALFKFSFDYSTQIFLFTGIFIAFAIKTPTIFLNS